MGQTNDDDTNDAFEKSISNEKRANHSNRHAEVIAETIESFVKMALNGKVVKAVDIVDHIPGNFTRFSWLQFVKKMDKQTPLCRKQPE